MVRHSEGLLLDKVPVLYQGVDASGPFIQWDHLDSLLPYDEMLAEWQAARSNAMAEKTPEAIAA